MDASKAVSMIARLHERKKARRIQRCKDDKVGTIESMSRGAFAARHTRCAHTPKSHRSLAPPRWPESVSQKNKSGSSANRHVDAVIGLS
jgi:hypothetical protein